MTYDLDRPTAELVRDLTNAAKQPEHVETGEAEVYALPAGYQLHYTDPTTADAAQAHPRRAKGTVRLHDLDSLIAYAQRHDAPESTTLWADLISGTFGAVLNDHGFDVEGGTAAVSDPGHGDWRATFVPIVTPEWERWVNHDGRLLDQEDFAEMVEDGIGEIASPDGATLLEIVQTLQGHTAANWRSAHRLRDGRVQLGYVEEVTATAGEQGQLEIPSEFTLVLPPYYGEQPVPMRARFRYRINGQKVRLGFKLDNPQLVRLNALRAMAGRLDEAFNAERVFRGVPR